MPFYLYYTLYQTSLTSHLYAFHFISSFTTPTITSASVCTYLLHHSPFCPVQMHLTILCQQAVVNILEDGLTLMELTVDAVATFNSTLARYFFCGQTREDRDKKPWENRLYICKFLRSHCCCCWMWPWSLHISTLRATAENYKVKVSFSKWALV